MPLIPYEIRERIRRKLGISLPNYSLKLLGKLPLQGIQNKKGKRVNPMHKASRAHARFRPSGKGLTPRVCDVGSLPWWSMPLLLNYRNLGIFLYLQFYIISTFAMFSSLFKYLYWILYPSMTSDVIASTSFEMQEYSWCLTGGHFFSANSFTLSGSWDKECAVFCFVFYLLLWIWFFQETILEEEWI